MSEQETSMGNRESKTTTTEITTTKKDCASVTTTCIAWRKFAECYKQYVLTVWMHHESGFSLINEDRQPLLRYGASLGSTMLVANSQTLENAFRCHAELIADFVEESYTKEDVPSKEILLGADTIAIYRCLMDHINYSIQRPLHHSRRRGIRIVWEEYVKALICMVEGFKKGTSSESSDPRQANIHAFETKAHQIGVVLKQQQQQQTGGKLAQT